MIRATKQDSLLRRKRRVRKRVFGTSERPRLSVFRSRNHIYAQLIDDLQGRTLAAASTMDKSVRATVKSGGTIDAAKSVGKLLAERAKVAQIGAVVFDRGGRLFHGRIKALAEASREGGLKF